MNYPCSTCLNAECTSWSTSLSCSLIKASISAVVMAVIIIGILYITNKLNEKGK